MAIPFTRYVDIISGLGASSAVARRDLIGRFFTTSIEQPTETQSEFTSKGSVGDKFGTSSDEFKRASFYFGFVSKSITSPNKISFARWADTATAPTVLGGSITSTVAEFAAITTGSITITFGSTVQVVVGIDLSGVSSFTDVATTLQVDIRASVVDSQFDTCVVAFDAVANRFTLVGGVAEAAVVDVTGTTLLGLLNWGVPDVRLSNGVEAETITEVLTASTALSNNFGSFTFIPIFIQSQILEAATWNDGNNVLFQYQAQVTAANAALVSADIIDLGGTGLTLNTVALQSIEFPEVLPMAILAATDYTKRAAVVNYMFQQSSLTATVTTNTNANLFDPLRVNYQGETQTAGQQLKFYQRGVLTGTGTDPVNMNTFANEQWLKDAAGTTIINLLIALPFLAANAGGRGQLLTVLREVVNQALVNGTIIVGKTLSATDIVFIEQQTGDPNAYRQVQTSGFWLDALIVEEVVDTVTVFTAVYTLIYSKSDVIRKVEGSHILI